MLEPMPGRYILDRFQVYSRANTEGTIIRIHIPNLESQISLWYVDGSWSTWREPIQVQVGHATQLSGGFKPGTLSL